MTITSIRIFSLTALILISAGPAVVAAGQRSSSMGLYPWAAVARNAAVGPGAEYYPASTDPYVPGPAAGRYPGTLAYTVIRQVNGMGPQFFLLIRSVGNAGESKAPPCFRLDSSGTCDYRPQFLPGTPYVAWRSGSFGDRYRHYNLDIIDLRLNRSKQIVYFADDQRLSWAADGRSLAHVGGDAGYSLYDGPTGLGLIDVPTGPITDLSRARAGRGCQNGRLPAWDHARLLFTAWLRSPNGGAWPTGPPDVWESAPAGQAPRRLVSQGWLPAPSPDGRWIAFLGWPGLNQTAGAAQSAPFPGDEQRLCLYDRRTGRRWPVTPVAKAVDMAFAPQMVWMQDGRRLVIAETIGSDLVSGAPRERIVVRLVKVGDIIERVERRLSAGQPVVRPLVSFPAQGDEPFNAYWEEMLPRFQALRPARDGRCLLYIRSRDLPAGAPVGDPLDQVHGQDTTVNALDLDTGKSEEICHVGENWGVDFVEGRVSAHPASKSVVGLHIGKQ